MDYIRISREKEEVWVKYILDELDNNYFNIAEKRINETQTQTKLF